MSRAVCSAPISSGLSKKINNSQPFAAAVVRRKGTTTSMVSRIAHSPMKKIQAHRVGSAQDMQCVLREGAAQNQFMFTMALRRETTTPCLVGRHEEGVKLSRCTISRLRELASGGFWGALIGLLFLSPLFGFAIGAAGGAISGALKDAGIDGNFMKQLGQTLKPGTAALCVLIRHVTPDKVLEEIQKFGGTLIKTNLSNENEAKLRAALASVQKSG